jgi:CHASE3 domain
MREVMEQQLALLEQDNVLRSTGGNLDAARSIALMDTGKSEMDRLRAIADAMEGEEPRLLVDRTRESTTAARRVRYTLALASALDLLLIVFMFRYFVRERELRLTAELTAEGLALSRVEVERKAAEIQELNEGLERRVAAEGQRNWG